MRYWFISSDALPDGSMVHDIICSTEDKDPTPDELRELLRRSGLKLPSVQITDVNAPIDFRRELQKPADEAAIAKLFAENYPDAPSETPPPANPTT